MNKYLKYTLIFLALVFIGFLLWYFSTIVLYILLAGLISLIGRPLVEVLCRIRIRKFQVGSSLAAGLTLSLIWLLIILAFSFFIPKVVTQINELSKINVTNVLENLDEPIKDVEEMLKRYNFSLGEELSFKKYATSKIKPILSLKNASDFFQSVATMLGDIFIAIFSITFISFFFLKEKNMAGTAINVLAPTRYLTEANHAMSQINKLLSRYFVGLIIEIILVITFTTLGMWLIAGLELNVAMVVGLIAGSVTIIPYIGPLIGSIGGIIIGVATHLHYNFTSELLPLISLMLLVYLIVHLIDNILFQPLIYSSSVKAHPLEIFLVILTAGHLAGIVGMLLAIPSFTVLRVIGKEFFNNYRLVKKLTEKLE